jgi:hypothetical protein
VIGSPTSPMRKGGSRVGIFSKKKSVEPTRTGPPRFGPGRRLTSDQDLAGVADSLSQVVSTHFPTPYKHMKTPYDAHVTWHGDGPQPAQAWSCSYGADDIFVFALWASQTGTEIGFFPLGGSEESLSTPMIGQWKQVDASLSSVGRIEPRLLSLHPPRISNEYYDETLQLAGKSIKDDNRGTLIQQTSLMFMLKAHGYIAGSDDRGAQRFVQEHSWNGDKSLPQRILDDLATWNYGVIPYLQDLPWRVRGILLEPGPDGTPGGDIWKQMV